MKLHLPDAVAYLAAAQHGAVLTSQLRSGGVSPAAQTRRIEVGIIDMPLRGVAVVPALADRFTRIAALQLRYPELIAERRAAAAIFGLDGFNSAGPPSVDLVDPVHSRPPIGRGVPDVRLAAVPPQAVTTFGGLRVTTPTWTLGELGAARVDADDIELALEHALRAGLTTEAKLRRVLDVRSGPEWPGTPVLAAALARRQPGAPPTGSYAETRFLQRVVRPFGLEDPERQVPVALPGRRRPYLCDFVFRRLRPLDIEIDGQATHATETGRDHDYERDHHVRRAGYEVVRFGAWRVEHKPKEIGHRLLNELAAIA